jgi:hypothetical protein
MMRQIRRILAFDPGNGYYTVARYWRERLAVRNFEVSLHQEGEPSSADEGVREAPCR